MKALRRTASGSVAASSASIAATGDRGMAPSARTSGMALDSPDATSGKKLRKLAEILSHTLRTNPAHRTRIRILRSELTRIMPSIRGLAWPLRGADRWESTPYSVDETRERATQPTELDDIEAFG